MRTVQFTIRLIFVMIVAVASVALLADDPSLPAKSVDAVKQFNLGAGQLALKGYDPVAYFVQNAAVKGKSELSAVHRGVTYYFATEQNRKLFQSAPARYLPAYGGWCATAMAKGEKVQVDPASFKVTNGRLFLFYNGLLGNALKDWNKNEAGLAAKADQNWKRIAGE